MTVSLDGLHPTLMRPRVDAVLADRRAQSLGLYVVSAFRSIERQRQLFDAAVAKYGSVAAARKWVAPPGSSNHGPRVEGYGTAVDFGLPGIQAVSGKWPPHIRAAIDIVCADHGLQSPMAWENWHYEPIPGWTTPAATSPGTLLEELMSLFTTSDDAAAALVRTLFLEHLMREPESEDEAKAWIGWLREHGVDATIYGIVDSPEGQSVLAAKRRTAGV